MAGTPNSQVVRNDFPVFPASDTAKLFLTTSGVGAVGAVGVSQGGLQGGLQDRGGASGSSALGVQRGGGS